MQVHTDLDNLPRFRNAVITIGTFDGVHRGHQQILRAMGSVASRTGGETILITFHPHPRKVIFPDRSLELINTLEEKTALLRRQGLDHLVIAPFTPSFASLPADAYLRDFLVKTFSPHTIIIGYDHHFGSNRTGNFALLDREKSRYGYELVEIPKHVLDEISISSTNIREALKDGRVERANEQLGYTFSFEGSVVHGDKLGRQLGYPTANLDYTDADKLHLGEGVYAAHVVLPDGTVKNGMLSIGKRPTLDDVVERVEVNIFDYSGDLYGQRIRVVPVAYLRPQEKYDTLEALSNQLGKDREESRARLPASPGSSW